jgi:hypothetical protein
MEWHVDIQAVSLADMCFTGDQRQEMHTHNLGQETV